MTGPWIRYDLDACLAVGAPAHAEASLPGESKLAVAPAEFTPHGTCVSKLAGQNFVASVRRAVVGDLFRILLHIYDQS